MSITAVVEASIPALGAVPTGLGPFEAYGYPDRSDEAEFLTKATVNAVRWLVTPPTVSRIESIPGRHTEDSAAPERPSR